MSKATVIDFRPGKSKVSKDSTQGHVFQTISGGRNAESLPKPPFSAAVEFYTANGNSFTSAIVENLGKAEAVRILREMLRIAEGKR